MTDYVWLLSSLQQQDGARSWLRPAKRTWALLESNPGRNNLATGLPKLPHGFVVLRAFFF